MASLSEEDPRIPSIPASPAIPAVPVAHPLMPVSQFIHRSPRVCNVDMKEQFVVHKDIALIRSLATSQSYRDDKYSLSYTKSGLYTVKSVYWVARNILNQNTEPSVCREEDETVNHAIFECLLALQSWALAPTPSCPGIFFISSIYSNLDYLFWRTNAIEDLELERDPYLWIIWFLWKAINEKLFRGIDRDPAELIRHAQRNSICLVGGSWTVESQYSGYGWVWIDEMGNEPLICLRNKEQRISPLHSELEHFGTDCKWLISMNYQS
ncbi:hypothetical protein N665_0173s0010 [Sinapis alba]|nr:hypothetical protein N665_0173s0010 [Sinapis alba]